MLDLQQLHTKVGNDFVEDLNLIPPDAPRGFHIHRRHGTPDLSNAIPWKQMFKRIGTLNREVLVNP